jgi:hypothetical protein
MIDKASIISILAPIIGSLPSHQRMSSVVSLGSGPNTERGGDMKHSHLSLLFVTLALAGLTGGLSYSLGRASQEAEKSLAIAKFGNAPLELVELKIGPNSIKNGIKSKFKDARGKVGLDDVKFRAGDDWSKNLKIRLRNISGRQIFGLSVSLFLQHLSSRTAFEIPLKRSQNRDLEKHPLQPGDEIDLEVNDASFNEAITKILRYGLNPNELPVTLYVVSALFAEDFGWFKGSLMRRDPNNPQKWDVVDKPRPPGTSQRFQQVG